MKKYLHLVLAQMNLIIVSIHNSDKIISYIQETEQKKADIVVFSELALTG
jgi:predicted amidohydrolase